MNQLPKPLISTSRVSYPLCLVPFLLWLLCELGPIEVEAREAATPYQLQSAFLYNFFRMVDWPKSSFKKSQNTVVLCLIGKNFFGDALTLITGKMAKGRVLQVHHLTGLEGVEGCHILYISTSEEARLMEILTRLRGLPVLTVSEISNFAELGGAIRFIRTRQDTIGLEINMDTTNHSRLRISSRILVLAKRLHDRPSNRR